MKYFLLLFIVLVLAGCNTTKQTNYYPVETSNPFDRFRDKNVDSKMPQKPGACYAKSLIPNQYASSVDTLGIFGVEQDIPSELLAEREIHPKTTKWVKKADKNCLSANPEDCLIWCLQETPAVYGSPMIKQDTIDNLIKQVVYLERKTMVQEGGYTDWKEVICAKDITKEFISSIRSALNSSGYEAGISTEVDPQMKAALINFQNDRGLPRGQLDLETLEALGVR